MKADDMTDDEVTAEILAIYREQDAFGRAVMQLEVAALTRGDRDLCEALSQLRLVGGGGFGDMPDLVLLECLGRLPDEGERNAWGLAFNLSYEAGNHETLARLERLAQRRLAH
ncbi:hypothetical protein [Histidinibacterium aquaticum]|uniref:Uncharacterized protein n=1 Tax=Histidinibacterium aquaticum TaxID=2613962 RepID=A0A5J5GN55_9RHOB|nr:hypothetical protein [Histidinibacterium aquaticum]KAA9009709.1 hypothetical protein F3S47_00075 [Histidinibacterium aquaticum]